MGRLAANDYAYFIYTSKATEIAMIEQIVQEVKSPDQASRAMVVQRQQGDL